ncbi:hypothetical protein DFH06DRAFT_1132575 [Mycena polygramma]|nr:hypothetical protein DFH06DRAFT_1132575 [Mycena polygramma]
MAPTAEARARYALELVEHTMRQFTAARETLENPSSAAKRKHPAAHAARDGPRGCQSARQPRAQRTCFDSAAYIDQSATGERRDSSQLLSCTLYLAIVPQPVQVL